MTEVKKSDIVTIPGTLDWLSKIPCRWLTLILLLNSHPCHCHFHFCSTLKNDLSPVFPGFCSVISGLSETRENS